MKQEECCGTCRYYKQDQLSGEWVCINPQSPFFGEECMWQENCIEQEFKQ